MHTDYRHLEHAPEWLCSGTVTLADFTVGSYLELAEAGRFRLIAGGQPNVIVRSLQSRNKLILE